MKLWDFLIEIISYINPFSENFILKDVLSFLTDMLSYINPFSENFFAYKLIELLKEALQFLFVPSEDSINNLVDTVKEKFRFVDTIKNTITTIQDMFEGTESLPVIKITLPENKWFNGQVVVMDLSWYAPYKTYGDTIISAFIYIFFIWRIYISLASIISGTGGAINDLPQQVGDIQLGKRSSITKRL